MSTEAPRPALRHVPGLDGLRGLALGGVLLFHANSALPGGYLGVDLFFVLSGYLITSLLLAEEQRTGRIDLGAFWVRRARRLLPAVLSLMPAIALYARYFAKPDELAEIRGDALATLGYFSNWRSILADRSYWQLFASPSPLEHTWSLAIEEQFYVVWPLLFVLVVLVVRAFAREPRPRDPALVRHAVLALALGLAAASIALTLYLYSPARTSRVYLGTDTRAAGILLGAALAALLSPNTRTIEKARLPFGVLGAISACGLGYLWWTLDGQDPALYRGALWLSELAVVVLIACAVLAPSTFVGRALAWRPLRWLGTISYGVYLWHWPINVFCTTERLHLHGLGLHVVRFALAFLIASLSYRYLERPILTRTLSFGRPVFVVPAAVALSALLVVRGTVARPALVGALPSAPAPVARAPREGTPVSPPFQLLMLGDSTANSLGWALRGVQKPGVLVELRGRDGCTMLADACGGETWSAAALDVRPAATLVVVGGAFMHGITAKGQWQKSCRPEWDARFETTLARRLTDLTSSTDGVWAVTVPYALGPWESATIRGEVDCINKSIRKVAASVPNAHVLELADYLCPRGDCALESTDGVIRPDGVHFSLEGARDLARWVLEQTKRAPIAASTVEGSSLQ